MHHNSLAIGDQAAGLGDPSQWAVPPRRPRLCTKQVHVWRARLDVSPAEVDRCYRLLSHDELVRAGRFVHDEVRERWIAARGFLRTVLGAYLERPAEDVRFGLGPRGKPELAGRGPLPGFNLSHSRDWALCAVAPARHVGVDVEQVKAVPIEELAAALNDEERAALDAIPPADRLRAFFETWTAKEAVAKATGAGLAVGLDRIPVGVGSRGGVVRTSIHPIGAWQVACAHPGEGYAGAVAVEGAGWRVRYWEGPPARKPDPRAAAGRGTRGGIDPVSIGVPFSAAAPFGTDLHG